jgi:hypothetical protein
MNHGGRSSRGRSTRACAQAVAVACAGLLAFGGVAVAAPKGDQGPPPQAQGNGPPATPPGQAKKQQAAPQGGDTHGKSGGGHAKARGNGHTGATGQAGGGGSSGSHGNSGAHANVNSQEKSDNGHAGKTTICHATHSDTNPYVEITVSNNAIPAHDRHQDGEDIIPAPAGGCPGGTSAAGTPDEHGNDNGNGKETICHATGSETNPYVRITISVNALKAHDRHQNDEDIIPAPAGDCPNTVIPAGLGNPPSGIESTGNTQLAGMPEAGGEAPESGVMGVSEESGSSPAPAGAVQGVEQGGVEGATEVSNTSGSSLPFTGLGLGLLVALGAMLALTGLVLRRRAAEE